MDQELLLFVREALAKGQPRREIQRVLLEAGWSQDEVNNALETFADTDFPVPVPQRRPYLSAREAFLYLVLFLTLYVSAFSLGTLVFQFINRAFPDVLEGLHAGTAALSAIRWSTASIIIAFPVFLLLSRFMHRAMAQDPEKRSSKIRKWLTYLTLFVAASAIICDLIALVFNVLAGELTTRFLLKVLTVGAISSTVFGYYLWDLRQDEREASVDRRENVLGLRIFAGVVSAVVTVAVVAGFVQAGSPGSARQQRLDERRVQDLHQISVAMDMYWARHEALSADLEELSRERQSYVYSIQDPETGGPYGYRVTGEKSYELCATFATESGVEERSRLYPVGSRFWEHGVGRTCFPIELEPDG